MGGEDLLAFDDLAVRRDAPSRRCIPGDHAVELFDIPVPVRFRQAQHRGVVDAVVALVQRLAQQFRRHLRGLLELGREPSHEDVGGQLLGQRQPHLRHVEEGAVLPDEPVRQDRARECVQHHRSELPRQHQRVVEGAADRESLEGCHPRQFLELHLPFQVEQQQTPALPESPIDGGEQRADQGIICRGCHLLGGELRNQRRQHLRRRHHPEFDQLLQIRDET